MLAQSSENCFLGVSQTGNAGPSYWSKTVPECMTSPQTWSPFSSSWLSSSAQELSFGYAHSQGLRCDRKHLICFGFTHQPFLL